MAFMEKNSDCGFKFNPQSVKNQGLEPHAAFKPLVAGGAAALAAAAHARAGGIGGFSAGADLGPAAARADVVNADVAAREELEGLADLPGKIEWGPGFAET